MRSKLGFHNFKHFYTDSINLINSLCCLRKSLRCLHFSQQKKLLHNKSSTKLHFFPPLLSYSMFTVLGQKVFSFYLKYSLCGRAAANEEALFPEFSE